MPDATRSVLSVALLCVFLAGLNQHTEIRERRSDRVRVTRVIARRNELLN